MSFQGNYALVTGSSRGIGRGIAVKLAQNGAKVAVHYYQNQTAAEATLAKIRECGSDGFIVQADVCRTEEISRMFAKVKSQFGALDIFVSNARTEVATFYQPPMDIGLDKFDTAVDSQAKAFLVGVREACQLMPNGGRIIAITYAPGGSFGSWQPWVAMGAAKAAMEVLGRYFAVALAPRQITVNTISPGWVEDSVLNTLPEPVQETIRNWHKGGWTPMGRLGTPADIGNAVALLCSAEAGWIREQIDTNTPTGKMVFTILGSVAELERSLIGERVRAGLRNARAKGTRLGRPPLKLLSAADVRRLRRDRRRSRLSFKELAAKHGVSTWTAFQLCKSKGEKS